MNCEERLAAFCSMLDGQGSRAERSEARRHVAECASCRAEAERLGHLHELLADERRRRAGWLAPGESPAAPSLAEQAASRAVQPSSVWPGIAIAAACAALWILGLALERPWRALPRLAVLAGDVAVNGRPARNEQLLPVGSELAVGESGSATLRYGDGAWLRLGARGRLQVSGGGRTARSLRLEFGQMQAELAEDMRAVELTSDLGGVRAAGAVFELSISPILEGAALDTPRTLRVAVARGEVRFTLPEARGGGVLVVPSGLSLRRIEGLRRPETPRPLLAAEWQRMLGFKSAPVFADNTLPADKVPAGVWVPRWPGRNGPTPGSRAGVGLYWSQKLGGLALSDGADRSGETWCYDARADRWRSVSGVASVAEGEGGEDGGAGRIRLLQAAGPPASREGAALAYSPKADAVVLVGGRGGENETWVYRCAEGRWTRLSPENNLPPRMRHGLGYDPAADLFVAYGGEGPGGILDDVWVFRLER